MSDLEARHTDQLIRKLGPWIEKISTPEFREFKRQQLSHTISDDWDRKHFGIEPPEEFVFNDSVDKQHALVMSFYELIGSAHALGECECYFRRFPFRDLPVSEYSHIRNVCEFYFMHFYIIKNKMWIVFRMFKKACPSVKGDMKAFLKAYDKEFKQELDWRHKVTHQYSFGDINIDRIMLTGMMSSTIKLEGQLKGRGWDGRHLQAYRAASKEWSARVKRRSADMEKFIDAVAKWILENANFL